MLIELKKFGVTLTSRDDGREALAAFKPTLSQLKKSEPLEINFDGINTLSPSWADEFIVALHATFTNRLKLIKSANPSVEATLSLLEKIHQIKFIIK